jgi:hypothetical protein
MRIFIIGTDTKQCAQLAHYLIRTKPELKSLQQQPNKWNMVGSLKSTRSFWEPWSDMVSQTCNPTEAQKQMEIALVQQQPWIFDQTSSKTFLSNFKTISYLQKAKHLIFISNEWEQQIDSSLHDSFDIIYIGTILPLNKQANLKSYCFANHEKMTSEILSKVLNDMKSNEVLAYYPKGLLIHDNKNNDQNPEDQNQSKTIQFRVETFDSTHVAASTSLVTKAVVSAVSATAPISKKIYENQNQNVTYTSPAPDTHTEYVCIEMILTPESLQNESKIETQVKNFWAHAIQQSPIIFKLISDTKFKKAMNQSNTQMHYFLSCKVDNQQDIFVSGWLLAHIKCLKAMKIICSGGIFV